MRSQSDDVEMGIIEYAPARDVVDRRCFDFFNVSKGEQVGVLRGILSIGFWEVSKKNVF